MSDIKGNHEFRNEVETLNLNFVRAVCEQLIKENARLRKAGDDMAKNYFELYWIMNAESTSRHEPASITNWEKAKENEFTK